jgi:hypothetical protein
MRTYAPHETAGIRLAPSHPIPPLAASPTGLTAPTSKLAGTPSTHLVPGRPCQHQPASPRASHLCRHPLGVGDVPVQSQERSARAALG